MRGLSVFLTVALTSAFAVSAHAETRSLQIAARLNGPYHIAGEGHEIHVDVAVSVGLAQYAPGESLAQLFRRVDQSMYRHKDTATSG